MSSYEDIAKHYQDIGWVEVPRKSVSELEASLQKAGRNGYQRVRLTLWDMDFELLENVQAKCRSWGMKLVVSLPLRTEPSDEDITFIQKYEIHPNLLVEHPSEEIFRMGMKWVKKVGASMGLIVSKDWNRDKFFSDVPPVILKNATFEFPVATKNFKGLEDKEIVQWMTLRSHLIGDDSPMRCWGEDVYDPRIESNRELEPEYKARWSSRTKDRDIQLSIIVPTYNNIKFLKKTLPALWEQSLPTDKYEVIVVNDGSTDHTLGELEQICIINKDLVNLSVIDFPRSQERQMGDAQFRVGVARNLGVKNSLGEILLFLDSDIVLPKNYLQRLIDEHNRADVILPQRIQLTKEGSENFKNYDFVDPLKDCYRSTTGYWEQFQEDRKPWGERAHPWKYVSTYCLSVKRKDFMKAGWFRKVFTGYGFEDTDLGYRLHRWNVRYSIISERVYHFYHEVARSEYARSERRRHLVLSRTAKIFFRQYVEKDIYELFKNYIQVPVFLGIRMEGPYFVMKMSYSRCRTVFHKMEMTYWKSLHPRFCDTYEALKTLIHLR